MTPFARDGEIGRQAFGVERVQVVDLAAPENDASGDRPPAVLPLWKR